MYNLMVPVITAVFTLFGGSDDAEEMKGRQEQDLVEMYSEQDISKCSINSGGHTNFGYWENGHSSPMSASERLNSQKDLNRYVLDHLFLNEEDKILEVGSGHGLAAQLIDDEYEYASYHGIDICDAQVKKAREENKALLEKSDQLEFQVGQAEKMNFDSETYQKIFSVEAAQHFYPFERFASEAYRVLKQDGKLVFTSTFATSKDAIDEAKNSLQTVRDDINRMISVDEMKTLLEKQGFKDIHIEPIGQYVFPGFDQWASQQDDFEDSWRRNWIKAYESDLLDYYVVSATKPVKVNIA